MAEKSAAEVIADGHRAHAIITDPVFCQATDALEAGWVAEWKREQDAAKRERLWALLSALSGVKDALGAVRQKGEVEAIKSKRLINR